MTVLVTGAAGFIGFHTAKYLLEAGKRVLGIDNFTPYYDVTLKQDRVKQLAEYPGFKFGEVDLCDTAGLSTLFGENSFSQVVHLAAQPGVRHSIDHPEAYVQSNLVGFSNILEACRHHQTGHLVFASTSSVYGANKTQPYSEEHSVDHPVSLYAATKKANEVMAHSYSHLYDLPVTGLRFFTVYGEWGRPDMAFFKFADAIINGRPIEIFNEGRMTRDFTYVGDIVRGISAVMDVLPTRDENWDAFEPSPHSSGVAPYRIFNIGNSKPIELMRYIEVLEECIGRRAIKTYLPMQPGDVVSTWADCSALSEATGYSPQTSIEEGLSNFVAWYKRYYKVN